MSGIKDEFTPVYKSGNGQFCSNIIQCLEFGSVGSAVFWLPGSGTAKNMQILGSKGQFINQNVKNCSNFILLSKSATVIKAILLKIS